MVLTCKHTMGNVRPLFGEGMKAQPTCAALSIDSAWNADKRAGGSLVPFLVRAGERKCSPGDAQVKRWYSTTCAG